MSYNGWSNYETWRVDMEVLDGKSCDDFGFIPDVERASTVSAQELADLLKTYCVELVEQEANGFALDLALSFLEDVDYREIAQHMIVDYFENNPPEEDTEEDSDEA
jgi:hypothetical protein